MVIHRWILDLTIRIIISHTEFTGVAGKLLCSPAQLLSSKPELILQLEHQVSGQSKKGQKNKSEPK